jgi:hypothetical protein
MSRWVSDCCLTQTQQSSWREQVNFQWNNDQVHFVQDQHDFYSASLLKQHNAGESDNTVKIIYPYGK